MRRLGILAAIVAAALVSPATASAATVDANRVLNGEDVEADLNTLGPDEAGTYLSCPAGTRAFSGGGFWHDASVANPAPANAADAWVSSNSATADLKGWYAAGFTNLDNLELGIRLTCIKAKLLRDGVLRQKSVAAPDGASRGLSVKCGAGRKVFTGGAFWGLPGAGPDAQDAEQVDLWANSPRPKASGWQAAGNNLPGGITDLSLNVYAHCLPAAQLAKYRMRVGGWDEVGVGVIGGTRECVGTATGPGGGYWHDSGRDFSQSGTLGDVRLAGGGSDALGGVYADGVRTGGFALLGFTVVAYCLT